MAKIKHIESGAVYHTAEDAIWRNGMWECGDQRFTDPERNLYEPVAGDIPAVIRFDYPAASARDTDIPVNIAVINPADNTPIPVTATYYVPLMNVITGAMDQMLVVPVVEGEGQVTFKVAEPGRYSINPELILPKPTAQLSETPDIAVF
ncbi:MAG: hypothetical protein ACXWE9_00965 [Methylobacter sp.]